MMNGALRCKPPQDLNPTQSMWRIESVTDLYYRIGLIHFAMCACECALGWQKPERSPSLFHFILDLLLFHFLSLLLIEFHSQNLSWQTYGIALWVWWHRTHNRIVYPYTGMPHQPIELHIEWLVHWYINIFQSQLAV